MLDINLGLGRVSLNHLFRKAVATLGNICLLWQNKLYEYKVMAYFSVNGDVRIPIGKVWCCHKIFTYGF